ncbi:MAG: dephospho-CoA kinase, partial [Peptococcaceae bacterium]|nr:dephospho-CoA kinase [Peptococcaceae bacterium]
MTKIIGLTGGIACGKSTVSEYLRQKGYPVVDADLVARKVVEPGSTGLAQIRDAFGIEYLLPDGSLNREMLGKKVFAEPQALKKLNSITGPLILEQLKKQLQTDKPVVFLDAAL